MQVPLLLLLLCVSFLLSAESVTLRSIGLEVTSNRYETQRFEQPAWSGRTRLVCSTWGEPWSVDLLTSDGDTVVVHFTCVEKESGFFESVPALDVSVRAQGKEYKKILTERRGLSMSNNDYMISLSWEQNRGLAVSCCGNNILTDIPIGNPVESIALSAPKPVRFVEWLTDAETVSPLLGAFNHREMLESLGNATDSVVGIYDYFDRDTDPTMAQPGGEYSLVLLPIADSKAYALCYLSGATVNPELWKSGMVKGILTPTEFVSHWNLRWLDSEFREVNAEQYLFFPGGNIIELVFPLYRSKLRFVLNPEKSKHLKETPIGN
ncbi:MAG: hypothetical protein K2O00_06040 [Muribaculaceae bacterium]|nr:hypothetical protein [Muribaculaceae bacterium]